MEKEMTGLYLSGHPMDKFEDYIEKSNSSRTFELLEASKNDKYQDGGRVNLCGIITHITVKQTRANKANMAFVTLEDLYGTIEVILFPKVFLEYENLIFEGNVIAVSGTLSLEEDKDAKILVNSVFKPNSKNIQTAQNQPVKKKNKRNGLFLKFRAYDDERIEKCELLLSIFDGVTPLYYYYEDVKKYELQPKGASVSVNPTMLRELKGILGDESVALID